LAASGPALLTVKVNRTASPALTLPTGAVSPAGTGATDLVRLRSEMPGRADALSSSLTAGKFPGVLSGSKFGELATWAVFT